MSDLTYRLVVDLTSRGSLLATVGGVGAAAQKADSALGRLKGTVGSLASGAASAFENLGDKVASVAVGIGKLAAVGAGAGIAYGVTHLNNELEQTKLSLGAIFNAQGAANGMRDGIRLAGDVVRDMRKDAAQLPGEFQDLLAFMRLGATPGLQAGASVQQLEKLSAQGMAAAAATGVRMDQASREFAMLLQGRAGAHNVFGTMLGLSGEKAEKFNKASGGERLKTLTAELSKYESAIGAYGNSFDALSSTMKDNGKQVLQKATAPLFDHVKSQLASANRWFDAHEDKVFAFAEKVGDKLAYAFEWGRMKILEWSPYVATFAENAYEKIASIWHRLEPLIARVGGKFKESLGNPATVDKLGHAAMLWGGLKIGGKVAPMLSPMMGAIGGGGGIAGAAAAAGPLAALLLGVAGAMHVLGDESNAFYGVASAAWEDTKTKLGSTIEHLGNAAERVGPIVVKFADFAGTILLVSLQGATTAIEFFAKAIDLVSKAIEFGIGSVADKVKIFSGGSIDLRELWGEADPAGKVAAPIAKKFDEALHVAHRQGAEDRGKTKTGAGGGGGGTHIQKVEIVVSSNQDPSRIARLTVDKLIDISKFPTSSPRTRNFSATRG